jgi:glycosyltransferase involved in cell wall biosynthesis
VDLRRALFDSGMKNIFNCVVKKYGRNNSVLLTMNNRYEIKNYSKSVMLVPDVIPITQQALFSSGNPRWNIIINDTKNACLNSKNWITFSNSTENAARQAGVVTEGTEIAIIPHASIPPGTAYKEFETIRGKGLDRQWVDYYWRAGQAKATNQLFKFSSFNQNLRYIIYPTQYRFHKNIEILMEAWRVVMKIHPDYKLVLTLDIDKHPQLNSKLRELGISNSVLFIPRLTDWELIAWQARAKFVLSCSSVEGAMPFVVSESMAVEVPFLIPEIPIAKEILPKSVLGASSVGIDSSLLLAQSLVDAIAQRDVILKIQTEWAKVYNRSWNNVWDDWILVIERISKT